MAEGSRWTFLTNHGHVLLCLARSPALRLRDVATAVGVTERAVQRIVADLEDAGYLTRRRRGRRNEYQIRADHALRHPMESHRSVRALIDLVRAEPSGGRPAVRERGPAGTLLRRSQTSRGTAKSRER